jgi:hypothetical protein
MPRGMDPAALARRLLLAALTVTNSTFSGNGARGRGGGIAGLSGAVTITNTIIANSTSGGNCSGIGTDGGHNIDDGTTCGFTGAGCASTGGSSFCNTNPQLDPARLANNGGPTQTIALLAGSPAINAGDESVCAEPPVNNLDQRGYLRPGTGHTVCSIGSYEADGVPSTGCVEDAPTIGCLTAAKSLVVIKKNAEDDTQDKLVWKWIKGAALTQMDLADPTSTASYALCVYAGSTNALIAEAALPPGSSWSAIGDKGYKFKGTSPDGLSLALLRGGAAGKSKALARGKGAALPDPTLPLTYPVTVQLKKDGSPLCLESTFTSANEKKNTDTQFKAKQ